MSDREAKYDADEWQEFFEAAQTEGFDRTDVESEAPAMSMTMVDAFEKLGDCEFTVQAAVDATSQQFNDGWNAEEFAKVVDSYQRSVSGEEQSTKPWAEIAVFNPLSGETYFFERLER